MQKQEKCQPSLNRKSVSPPFKKNCPCTRLSPPFINFSDFLPSWGGNQNLLLPPLKKKVGGPKLCYEKLFSRYREGEKTPNSVSEVSVSTAGWHLIHSDSNVTISVFSDSSFLNGFCELGEQLYWVSCKLYLTEYISLQCYIV